MISNGLGFAEPRLAFWGDSKVPLSILFSILFLVSACGTRSADSPIVAMSRPFPALEGVWKQTCSPGVTTGSRTGVLRVKGGTMQLSETMFTSQDCSPGFLDITNHYRPLEYTVGEEYAAVPGSHAIDFIGATDSTKIALFFFGQKNIFRIQDGELMFGPSTSSGRPSALDPSRKYRK